MLDDTSMSAKVLVVDDDPAVLDSLQLLLRSAGIEVEGFGSAQECLAAPQLDDAACLVVDVRLPGMSGLDLVRRLRTQGRMVPAILITGHLEALSEPQAEADRILAILHKPFTAEELFTWVRRAMQS
jgi:FixJ family two-component response regulator